jgi:hypothetical protein
MRSPCFLCVLLSSPSVASKRLGKQVPTAANNRRTVGFGAFCAVRVVSNTQYVVTGDKSVYIRKVLRPVIATQVFFVFLCL